jgi:hypothetical protein
VVEDSDFYEKTYSTVRSDVQTRVRNETYDEDLGRAGWLQATEAHEFASWLGSGVMSVLDVACGSGGISALLTGDRPRMLDLIGRKTDGWVPSSP